MTPAESQDQRAHPWPIILGFAVDARVFRHSLLGKKITTCICDVRTISQRTPNDSYNSPAKYHTDEAGLTGDVSFLHRASRSLDTTTLSAHQFFSCLLHYDSRDLR